ncbi:SRPBCC domain-containing protein [Algoriphagus sp. D3-2-R+10]|uniref:SRPBCC family protein n=1 Tax=Algoriphagus aurantiacus TaxID=3103948 RepID=UPI002B3DEF04|nr:SRPBCC domain-containing protein [Algoriphagus sp. D3-2-R+10]MEB2776549.1 SRPBCC domain-containing protein [Algoriphagus sp. D3-2-R+10]
MNSSEEKIELTRIFEAPIGRVWEALVNPAEQKKWYFDFGPKWKLEVGQVFEWEAGDPAAKIWLHRGKINDVVNGRKLVHSWEYPGYIGYSILTWLLISQAPNRTELKLCHFFEVPFDPAIPALQKEQFEKGWNYIVNTSLMEYLEK